jgi:hypothetical protein
MQAAVLLDGGLLRHQRNPFGRLHVRRYTDIANGSSYAAMSCRQESLRSGTLDRTFIASLRVPMWVFNGGV